MAGFSAGSGSKGESWYDWACIPINHMLGPNWQRYLLIRRSIEKTQEVAFYRVFCKADTALAELVHVAGQRWSMEQCFQLAKGETGLDQYEVRKWKGWYRHINLSMQALAFLLVQRTRKKKSLKQRSLFPSVCRKFVGYWFTGSFGTSYPSLRFSLVAVVMKLPNHATKLHNWLESNLTHDCSIRLLTIILVVLFLF